MTAEAAMALAGAEAALDAKEYATAVALLSDTQTLFRDEPRAAIRALLDEAWARMSDGDVHGAIAVLDRARAMHARHNLGDLVRARIEFQYGCCRLKLGDVPSAVQSLTVAFDAATATTGDTERLHAEILCWRARCYRRQREWIAARADAERAIQLAEDVDDASLLGDAYLQASQVAERTGQLLVACFYADRAAALLRDAGEMLAAGKALNNVGGICFLLGRTEDAKRHLKDAFTIALELDDPIDAAYAVSSTAQVMLRTGDVSGAEANARYALELLGEREDHANEVGSASLVLGRALLAQHEFVEAEAALAAAEVSFAKLSSIGHSAAAWLAQGDAAAQQHEFERSSALYRRAAEALQDVRF